MTDDVGERLRSLRKLRGVSQRELAKQCGVTHSSLSLIEQGKVSPSVSSLKKILNAFAISVGDFFTMDLDNQEQIFYSPDELVDIGTGGVTLKLVGANRPNRGLTFMIEHYPPGTDTGREMIVHFGEEAGIVLEGEIEVTVGSSVRRLGPGESYYFKTNVPHRFHNISDRDCKIISCASPSREF